MNKVNFSKGDLSGVTAQSVANIVGCSRKTVYNNLNAGKGKYYERIIEAIKVISDFMIMPEIIEGCFEVVDYDRDNITATIVRDDHPAGITVSFTQDDLLSVAMSFGDLCSYFDPQFDGGPYHAETWDHRKVSFQEWWEGLVDETDRERYFRGAVIEKARDAMKKAYKEIQKSV